MSGKNFAIISANRKSNCQDDNHSENRYYLVAQKKSELKMISNINKKILSKSTFNLAQYIENNEKNIDYATYKKRGWYVGSGAIESGNKTVLQFRLKQPRMRWSQDCGQYIVSLMARSKSGLWERDVEELVRGHYEVEGAGLALSHRNMQFYRTDMSTEPSI